MDPVAKQAKGAPVQVPPGWTLDADGKSISVRVETRDFMSAVGLVNEIALIAETLEHHPDIHLTGYKKLEIRSSSHDVGGLTDRDERLATRIQALLTQRGLKPQR